jgi:hypothetical protein
MRAASAERGAVKPGAEFLGKSRVALVLLGDAALDFAQGDDAEEQRVVGFVGQPAHDMRRAIGAEQG